MLLRTGTLSWFNCWVHRERVTAIMLVNLACNLVQNLQYTYLWSSSKSNGNLKLELDEVSQTNINMHMFIHKGTVVLVYAQTLVCCMLLECIIKSANPLQPVLTVWNEIIWIIWTVWRVKCMSNKFDYSEVSLFWVSFDVLLFPSSPIQLIGKYCTFEPKAVIWQM